MDQSVAGDSVFVDYRFAVGAAQADATYRWSFDDGTTALGPVVTHTFLRLGLRKVRLDAGASSVTQEVDVHPHWAQIQEWSEEHFAEQRRWLLSQKLDALPVEDLLSASRLAETVHDTELLTALGETCLKRSREFSEPVADLFFAFGGNFQEPSIRRYDAAEQALRLALSWPSDWRERSKLRLARLLLDTFGKLNETSKLLDEIQPSNLTEEQRRLLAILRADLTLAHGDRAGAETQYLAISRRGELDRARYSVQRQARLESARAFLGRHEYEAAENLVRTVEWEVPVERLAPDFSLLLAKVYLARQEFPRALLRCQRLLTVTNQDNLRAEVLFYLVEIEHAMKLDMTTAKSLQQLLTQYPFSEFAARAKERWPQSVTEKTGK